MRRILGLVVLASAQAACGGSVDDHRQGTTSGGAGAGGTSTTPLSCGDKPNEGQIVTACIPMNGDFCPPAETTPGLLVELAKAQDVCAETTPASCCGKAAYRQVVCDQIPGTSTCCYDVHYVEKVVCP